jgi:16S rRNA (cytosine1402-N4)-methyltransferase
VDGILADIGVSSHQFDAPYRGFSIRFEEEALDMRMNRSQDLDAKKLLNTYEESKLADVLYYYGELRNSRLLAQKLVKYRAEKEIVSLKEVREALKGVLKPHQEKATLVQFFQALRIEVNDELGALKSLLNSSGEMIKPGGRLVVISYHSLEDRLVKNYLRSGNFEGKVEKDLYGNFSVPFTQTQSKPIVPGEAEVSVNPRSRSARMRIGIKT